MLLIHRDGHLFLGGKCLLLEKAGTRVQIKKLKQRNPTMSDEQCEMATFALRILEYLWTSSH